MGNKKNYNPSVLREKQGRREETDADVLNKYVEEVSDRECSISPKLRDYFGRIPTTRH